MNEFESIAAPTDLEDKVVRRLHAEGLLVTNKVIGENSMRRIHLRWGIAASALLLAGIWAGRQSTSGEAVTTVDRRPSFALMLYEDAAYQAAPADKRAERVAEYSDWARDLARRGHLVDGAELAEGGEWLRADRSYSVLPTAHDQPALTGYFVIRAASLREARDVSRECPHLKYGGMVALRPIAG